jgi:antitoxin component of RelBE/YafQ-DinJ toxin-antitoxin module
MKQDTTIQTRTSMALKRAVELRAKTLGLRTSDWIRVVLANAASFTPEQTNDNDANDNTEQEVDEQ